MLTLRRFEAMVASYGADRRRWPAALRDEAEALLAVSAEACALAEEARVLDEAIAAAGAHEDWALRGPGVADAALARLRSGVAARIVASPPQQRPLRAWLAVASWAFPLPLGWIGMATGAGAAMAVGFLVGGIYTSAPAPGPSLTMLLQSAPIHALAD